VDPDPDSDPEHWSVGGLVVPINDRIKYGLLFTYSCPMECPEVGRNVVVSYNCMTDTLVLLGFFVHWKFAPCFPRSELSQKQI
jgi:hypothetical protein